MFFSLFELVKLFGAGREKQWLDFSLDFDLWSLIGIALPSNRFGCHLQFTITFIKWNLGEDIVLLLLFKT